VCPRQVLGGYDPAVRSSRRSTLRQSSDVPGRTSATFADESRDRAKILVEVHKAHTTFLDRVLGHLGEQLVRERRGNGDDTVEAHDDLDSRCKLRLDSLAKLLGLEAAA